MRTSSPNSHAWVWYPTLLVLAIPFLLPLLWMLSTAFKTPNLIYLQPPQWIPHPVTLQNFTEAWGLLDFPRFIRNSAFVAVLSVIGSVFSSSIVGFAFATLTGRGKNLLFNHPALCAFQPVGLDKYIPAADRATVLCQCLLRFPLPAILP